MSSVGSVLLGFVLVLLSVIPPLLFAAVCFYACWYAVKNSPTLRTRRFAVSAVLDLCVLLWLISFATTLLARVFNLNAPIGDLRFFPFLPYSTHIFLFNHLPLLLVFSAFIVYIVLRWRQLLYEDSHSRINCPSREGRNPDERLPSLDSRLRGNDGEGSGDSEAVSTLLAKTLEREITFFRNFASRYRTSTLTVPGICIKRNIVLVLVVLFCVYYFVKQSLWLASALSNWEPSTWQYVGFFAILALGFLCVIAFYALFFWIISKAIGIAWDDAALEKSPPKIPLSQWNEAKLRPEGRRRMLVDSVLLLCMVPLMLILMFLGSGLVQELLFSDPKHTIFSLPRNLDIGRLIMILVVLVMLTVLWCSYNPAKRLLGFARLFLVSGLLALCFIEWEPLTQIVASYWQFGLEDMTVMALSRWEMLSKIYLSWHLTAGAFLVYSLLAAAVCYFLRAWGEIE